MHQHGLKELCILSSLRSGFHFSLAPTRDWQSNYPFTCSPSSNMIQVWDPREQQEGRNLRIYGTCIFYQKIRNSTRKSKENGSKTKPVWISGFQVPIMSLLVPCMKIFWFWSCRPSASGLPSASFLDFIGTVTSGKDSLETALPALHTPKI